jgi:AcrR family transcriptional regulator
VPRSPEPARRQLLDAALELFARDGIAGVSLREIGIAGRQRNTSALHYHFGSKEGVLRALLQRELPPVVERRRMLLAEAGDDGDLRAIARAIVLPFAELATGTPHERAFVRVLAHLHGDVSFTLEEITDLAGDTAMGATMTLVRAGLRDVSEEVVQERMAVAMSGFLYAAAIRAQGGRRTDLISDDVFRENLVDMFHGALTAPVGSFRLAP